MKSLIKDVLAFCCFTFALSVTIYIFCAVFYTLELE